MTVRRLQTESRREEDSQRGQREACLNRDRAHSEREVLLGEIAQEKHTMSQVSISLSLSLNLSLRFKGLFLCSGGALFHVEWCIRQI